MKKENKHISQDSNVQRKLDSRRTTLLKEIQKNNTKE